MRVVRRLALGFILAVGLLGLTWTAMSGCSLDWTVPEPGEDARTDPVSPDGPDAAIDHPVDQSIDVSLDADFDALDGSFDAIPGDAVVPCAQLSTCQECVACVLDEVSGVGDASDCRLFGGCMVICLIHYDLLPCIDYCGTEFPAGLQVRQALDGTCLIVCGGAVPCE